LLSAILEAGTAAVAATAGATVTAMASATRTAEWREERPAAGEQNKGSQKSGFGQLGQHRDTMEAWKKSALSRPFGGDGVSNNLVSAR
jgi:hypothetical protein